MVREGRQLDMPGNSKRKGAIKKTGKGNPTAGSGGGVRQGLEGKGPTPQGRGPAEPQGPQEQERAAQKRRRPHGRKRQAGRRRRRVGRRAQPGGRGAEGERAGTALYVAERIDRDDRVRESSSSPPSSTSACSRSAGTSSTGSPAVRCTRAWR